MSPEEVWSAVLAELRKRTSDSRVVLWIEQPIRVGGTSVNRLVLRVDDRRANWVQSRYGRLLGALVREVSDLDGIVIRREELRKIDAAKALGAGE